MVSASSTSKVQELALNVLEVELSTNQIRIFETPFSKTAFDNYKAKYQDYFFYRFGDSIYAWEIWNTEETLSNRFKAKTITIEEHAPIFRKVIEESIVQYFRRRGFDTYKDKYSSTWEVSIKKEQPTKFWHLSLIPNLVFSVTNIYSTAKKEQVFGLTIRKAHKPRFTIPEVRINRQGIDTSDWDRNTRGEIVASSRNRRIYLEATGQTFKYLKFLKTAESDQKEYEFLQSSLENFNQVKGKLFLPDDLEISNFQLTTLSGPKFQSGNIIRPRYYFYNEKTTSTDSYDNALKNLRPYSYDLFANKTVSILVVTPEKYEEAIDKYLDELDKVLKSIFHLRNIEYEIVAVSPQQGYFAALEEIDLANYDLAIIVVSQQQKKLPIQKSPYYVLKAKLLNQRLPTQDFTIEKIKKNDPNINKTIALNIYSKLGGTAWTIEALGENVPELIIGIGSTTDDQANMIIGFANIFDYNGTYLLGDCSQLSTLDDYAKNLEDYLVRGLAKAFEKKNISEGDSIRLVFHLFKDAGKEYEIEAIQNALTYFREYSVEYALVHLSDNHNYRMYRSKGSTQIIRGTYVQITSLQSLLHLGGSSTVPILVKLDKRSDYKDIKDITKQVLYFSHLSHRSFVPPNEPVTIKYPSRMAKIVTDLRKVPDWDPQVLNRLSEKLWFI